MEDCSPCWYHLFRRWSLTRDIGLGRTIEQAADSCRGSTFSARDPNSTEALRAVIPIMTSRASLPNSTMGTLLVHCLSIGTSPFHTTRASARPASQSHRCCNSGSLHRPGFTLVPLVNRYLCLAALPNFPYLRPLDFQSPRDSAAVMVALQSPAR